MSRSLTNFYETQEIRCRLGLAQRIVVFRFPNINHSWTLDDAMLFDEIQTFFRENVVALLKFSLLLKNSKQNVLSFSLSIHCYYLLNSAKFQLQDQGPNLAGRAEKSNHTTTLCSLQGQFQKPSALVKKALVFLFTTTTVSDWRLVFSNMDFQNF